MSRPIYCRAEDRQNEARALDAFVARLNRDAAAGKCQPACWSHRPAGKLFPYDAVLQRNGLDYALVEVKSRNGRPGMYGEWHIAKHKIDTCLSAAAREGLYFILIFAWDGKPFVLNVSKTPGRFPVHVGGRYDRNDAADVEEMYLIPSNLFKAI